MATIPAETLPASVVATVIGLVVGVGEIVGGVFSPVIGGMAADLHGLQAPLYMQIGLCIVASILSLFLTETAPVKVKAKAA
jgi:membrane protein implicated in regulation of membrane protease activity